MFKCLNKSLIYTQGTQALGVPILTPGCLGARDVLLREPVSHSLVSCSTAGFCLPFVPWAPCEGGVHSDSLRVATPSMPGAPQSSLESHSTQSFSSHLPTQPYLVSLNILCIITLRGELGWLDSPEYSCQVFLPLRSNAGHTP